MGFTDIGSYPNSASPNGTFDQGGNGFEWVHGNPSTGLLRGGSFNHVDRAARAASRWTPPSPMSAYYNTGFRVSSAAVPEPSTGLLLLVGIVYLSFLSIGVTP